MSYRRFLQASRPRRLSLTVALVLTTGGLAGATLQDADWRLFRRDAALNAHTAGSDAGSVLASRMCVLQGRSVRRHHS